MKALAATLVTLALTVAPAAADVEVLPGVVVPDHEAPAVITYLKAVAHPGQVEFGGEWVPPALDLYDWNRLAHCESTNRWHLRDGGVQIIPSTWRAYGGREFAPLAGQASVAEQLVVARRIYDDRGERPWTCRW